MHFQEIPTIGKIDKPSVGEEVDNIDRSVQKVRILKEVCWESLKVNGICYRLAAALKQLFVFMLVPKE